jgi:hypothetical protein
MSHRVAALFVQAEGIYSKMPEVDPWPEARDARTYSGPLPVVAHPPCQLWGRFAKINYARWGGEHNKPGNDGGCFAAALASVNRCGGVLEHPADSHAWITFGLARPPRGVGSTTVGTLSLWIRCGIAYPAPIKLGSRIVEERRGISRRSPRQRLTPRHESLPYGS